MIRKNAAKLNEILRLYWRDNPEIYHRMMEERICRLWGEVLGSTIAQCTSNTFVKNRVLHVSLTSSVIRSELVAIRKRLVITLNNHAGSDVIDEIVIR